MKKLLVAFVMVSMLFGFTGCFFDEEAYVNHVKTLTFQDGTTIESIVVDKVVAIEFEAMNEGQISTQNGFILFNESGEYVLNSQYLSETIVDLANNAHIQGIYEMPNIEWSVAGKTNNGKIISAKSDHAVILVEIVENGDYIECNTNDIRVSNEGLWLTDEQINFNLWMNNIMYSYNVGE